MNELINQCVSLVLHASWFIGSTGRIWLSNYTSLEPEGLIDYLDKKYNFLIF